MKAIGIIVFYFGELPWYHNYFIDSCKRNPGVDFLFFSDNYIVNEKEDNLLKIPFTLESFNSLASKKLGFQINIENGLKICDFRPAFGLIFEDYLKSYDFWGYSDTDIILGNLRNFLDTDVLDTYDYISVKDDYPSGFFSVLRNCPEINMLFKLSKDYKYLFSKKENTLFEECGGAYSEVCNGINILNSSCKYETFHHVLEKHSNTINCLFELYSVEGNIGDIIVCSDKITFLDKYEVMMYHLTGFKVNSFSIIPREVIKAPFGINLYNFYKIGISSYFFNIFIKNYINIKQLLLFSFLPKLSQPVNLKSYSDLINKSFVYMGEYIAFEVVNNKLFFFYSVFSDRREVKVCLFLNKFLIVGDFLLSIRSSTNVELININGRKKNFILMQ